MTAGRSRRLRSWLRDMGLGATIFLLLPLLAATCQGQNTRWVFDDALAGNGATLTLEMSSQSGSMTETAGVTATLLAPAGALPDAHRFTELAVLGFTFSLLVAFNLAFVRHLRRVCASPRRGMWRRWTQ